MFLWNNISIIIVVIYIGNLVIIWRMSLIFFIVYCYCFCQDDTLKQQMNSFLLSTQSQHEIQALDNKVQSESFYFYC